MDLSGRELAVLELLLLRAGKVVTKQQIVDNLYGWEDVSSSNAVEVFIYRLRKKLEASGRRHPDDPRHGISDRKARMSREQPLLRTQLLKMAAGAAVAAADRGHVLQLLDGARVLAARIRPLAGRARARGIAAPACERARPRARPARSARARCCSPTRATRSTTRSRRRTAGSWRGERSRRLRCAPSGPHPRCSTTARSKRSRCASSKCGCVPASSGTQPEAVVRVAETKNEAQRAGARDPAERGRAAGGADPHRGAASYGWASCAGSRRCSACSRRSPGARIATARPVVVGDVPGEVKPLMDAINALARAAGQHTHDAEPLHRGRGAPAQDARGRGAGAARARDARRRSRAHARVARESAGRARAPLAARLAIAGARAQRARSVAQHQHGGGRPQCARIRARERVGARGAEEEHRSRASKARAARSP